MSRLARRTRGMEGITERTRIKRGRKLPIVQDKREPKTECEGESQTSETTTTTTTKKEHLKKKNQQKKKRDAEDE